MDPKDYMVMIIVVKGILLMFTIQLFVLFGVVALMNETVSPGRMHLYQ